MLSVRTILHPTDFSEQAGYALELTCALARDTGARLILLHVVPPPTVVVHAELAAAVMRSQAEERDQLNHLAVPDAVAVERRVEEGDPAAEIVRVARESNADMIVMATHGRGGLWRLLMGSVAEQVLRHATRPVLTVKTPGPDTARA